MSEPDDPPKDASPHEVFFGCLILIVGSTLLLCILVFGWRGLSAFATSLNPPAETPTTPNSADDRIDAFVDQQVAEHWRPIPGGNSKEDAKALTRDVMKAKNWNELQEVMERHSREGR